MSQEEILKLVNSNPGIIRTKIHRLLGVSVGTASQQITKLAKEKELIQIKSGQDYKLYPYKTEAS